MLHDKLLGTKEKEGVLTSLINDFDSDDSVKSNAIMADIYLKSLNADNTSMSKITSFLQDKEVSNHTNIKIESGDYLQVFIFDDKSVLTQKVNGQYQSLSKKQDISEFHQNLVSEMVSDEFKKSQKVTNGLLSIVKEMNPFSTPLLKEIISTYKSNMNILKINNVDIVNTYNKIDWGSTGSKLRAVQSTLENSIKEHKLKQYVSSVKRPKYNSLFNDESFKIIETIFNDDIPLSDFKKEIGKYMVLHKSPEDFNVSLKRFHSKYQGFSIAETLAKASELNTPVISSDDSLIVFRIDNFEQSKLLGSDIWAISRMKEYFDGYTDKGREQYFVFDHSKEFTDHDSLIGITMDKNTPYVAHYKTCEPVELTNDVLKKAVKLINDSKIELTQKSVVKSHLKNQ